MKYLWYNTAKCKEEPSPAAKRVQLMKEYTFRLPHRKKPDVFGKKKKWPEDIFPQDFQYASNCKKRSYSLGKYFDEYLDSVEPPLADLTIINVIQIPKPVGHRVSDINPVMSELEAKRVEHLSKQMLKRRKNAKSSTLWSIDSIDVMVKKGVVREDKMEELYKIRITPAVFAKDEFNPYKVYNWGEKGSGLHSMGPIQDFRSLREACFRDGVLFEDPYFPATEKSLCYSSWHHKVVGWKRPKELCENPKLFIDGASRFDVHQGSIGNCWMLAALCSLTMRRKLFFQVVPLDQAFDEMYAGIFHFRLWNDGKWIDVVIDDRLPVNAEDELYFVQISSKNEFWPALLEKAYAKMQGTYEHIEAGLCSEAFIEFTGGLVETIDLINEEDAFHRMKEAWDREALICISSNYGESGNQHETIPEGLVLAHAYTVSNVIDAKFWTISGPLITEKLVRIRNPWGKFEWNGAWSEKSHEWLSVPEKTKKNLDLRVADDGEFWMAFKDVVKFFSIAYICHVSPYMLGKGDKWILSLVEGEWVKGVTAGGNRKGDTYHMNPQYFLQIFDDNHGNKKTSVIVSLLCKNRRRLKHVKHTYLSVNVSTFQVGKDFPKPLPPVFFKTVHGVDTNVTYQCHREIMCKYDLSPGFYVVVPSTWEKEDGEFLLRFYSEKMIKVCPYDNEIGIDDEMYTKGYTVEYDQHTEEAKIDDVLPIETLFIEKDPIGIHSRKEILDKFLELAGNNEIINWIGLRSVLGFALETIVSGDSLSGTICRSLVALFDVNCMGALYLVQFFMLWSEIIFWVQNFYRYKDSNDEMSVFTLRDAIHDAGFTSNTHLLNLIMHRYGNKRGTLNLQDFLIAIIKFKHMMDAFTKKMNASTKKAKFEIGEFFELALYS